MATTSIWRVKGWLGKVVIYVENPDKTENPAFYEKQEMTDRQAQDLSDVIDYAVNSEKTQAAGEATEVMQQFVSGINCHPATAREEMIAVKKRFGKEDGTVAYHGYQSFAPGEATPEMAHEIGVKLAQQLWGDKYQVIVATHLDKDSHLHNHFVVNTVSFLDGLKYHRTEKDYYDMQKASDALCREYGLSVIENPQRGKSRQYGEWRAEQEGRPTWRGLIRAEIDEVIRQSMTERQFFDNLRKRGYEVKVGKDMCEPGKRPSMAYILRKAPRRNMRLTAFRAVRKQSLMKPPTSLTSRAVKVFRRPGRTFPRQRSILNSVKLMQNSQKREQDSTAQTLNSIGRQWNSARQTCRKSRPVKRRLIISAVALRIRPASP